MRRKTAQQGQGDPVETPTSSGPESTPQHWSNSSCAVSPSRTSRRPGRLSHGANGVHASGHVQVMEEIRDEILWQRTAEGDREAFGVLFDRHSRRVFRFCLRQTGNWAEAEDLMAMTFLEIWRRRTDLDVPSENFQAWLLGVSFNVIRNRRRANQRYKKALERSFAAEESPDHADGAAARVSAERCVRDVLPHFRKLPKREQEVLALVGWEGLTIVEAAIALGVPEPTVRSRLHRARQRLLGTTESDNAAGASQVVAATKS